jgi:hypothetical protein
MKVLVAATATSSHARTTRRCFFAAVNVFFEAVLKGIGVKGHFGFGQIALLPGLNGLNVHAALQGHQGECKAEQGGGFGAHGRGPQNDNFFTHRMSRDFAHLATKLNDSDSQPRMTLQIFVKERFLI